VATPWRETEVSKSRSSQMPLLIEWTW
jgi:hypothetical protein